MIQEVATWLLQRRWTRVVDSGYTALARYPLSEGHIIEQGMWKNTVVYDLAPTRRRPVSAETAGLAMDPFPRARQDGQKHAGGPIA
jgi:hypothetical protein